MKQYVCYLISIKIKIFRYIYLQHKMKQKHKMRDLITLYGHTGQSSFQKLLIRGDTPWCSETLTFMRLKALPI